MTLDEFNNYFNQHAGELQRTAQRLLLREHCSCDAVDVVNQVYVQLQHRHGQIDAARVERYVYRSMQNVVHDMGRSQAVQPEYLSDDQIEQIADPEFEEEGDPRSIAQCEAVMREALTTLTPSERRAFVLFLANDRAAALQQMAGYDGAATRAKIKLRQVPGELQEIMRRLGLERLRELATEPPESPGV